MLTQHSFKHIFVLKKADSICPIRLNKNHAILIKMTRFREKCLKTFRSEMSVSSHVISKHGANVKRIRF